jgi:chromosomal replication initiator protein
MPITDMKKTWEDSLNEIELEVSKATFKTWFQNTHLVREEGGTVFVGVPNEFIKEWLSNKYHKSILRILRKDNPHVRSVEYIISKKPAKGQEEPKKGKRTAEPQPTRALPLQNLYIDRKDNLNPRYTFESFIIGPFNELAYSAAQGIIQKPGVYNPLFIYGGTGLGKTHLIQAIGNKLKEEPTNAKVFYTSSEKFTMDYISSVQNNRVNAFKEKYRKYDVFVMDDVQFLSGKEKTQEELFHLFNILYDNNKQIIFSSDKHPNYIPGLEDRLKSRFGAGMIVDVTKPDYESKVAILQTKADEQGCALPKEVIDYIATNVEGSIRELEGLLNSLICQIDLRKRNLTSQELKNLIKNNIRPKKNVSVKDIVKIIANFYNVDEKLIYEKTRRKEIVHSRQIAMYLLREDFNISYPLIGRKLGGRDHTTVIHSCLKIKKELEDNGGLAQELEQLRSMMAT